MPITQAEWPLTANITPDQLPQVLIRSNLSLLGAFLFILRERFSTEALDDMPWAWVEEPAKTDIVIELAYSEDAERRGVLPGIYLGKTPTVWSPIVIGDRAGVNLPRAEETKIMHANTSVIANVVSRHLGECFVLADVVSHAFLNASDFIRSSFNIRDVFRVVEGAPNPYPKETNLWQIPISVDLEFTERWVQQEVQSKVGSIKVFLPTGDEDPAYYAYLSLTSLTPLS